MKKIASLFVLLGFVLFGTAQVDPATITRLYLWERPVTDSFNFPGLPGKLYPVIMFSADGKYAFTALFDSTRYAESQHRFLSQPFIEESKTKIGGYEYVVQYIPKFSKLKRRDIRKLSGMARITAQAFNDSDKFTVMSLSPQLVVGERDSLGNKVLKFFSTTETNKKKQEVKYSWQQ